MRIEDAPPAGWYPDPEGTSRLRWWEGTDWSDRYRARPIDAAVRTGDDIDAVHRDDYHRWVPEDRGLGNTGVDTQAVVDQVRIAARQEAERAAQMFGQQARSATQNLTPLITQYTNRVVRWIRFAIVIAILIGVVWLAFQLFAQISFFTWLGDRIDNLTDQDSAGVPLIAALSP